MNEPRIGVLSELLLEAALDYAALGRHVFPVKAGTKNQPLTRHGFKEAATCPAVIHKWWGRWPEANIGIATGAVSGSIVIDTDVPDGEANLAALGFQDPGGPLATTPRGGRHYWYKHPGYRVPCSAGKVATRVDVRGDGGYVIVAPSRTAADEPSHTAAGEYHFQPGRSFFDVPLPECPAWLLEAACKPGTKAAAAAEAAAEEPTKATAEPVAKPPRGDAGRLAKYVAAALDAELQAVAGAPEGTRNDQLNRSAYNLGTLVGAGVLPYAIAEAALLDAAGRAGLLMEEARNTIRSGLEAGQLQPRTLPTPAARAARATAAPMAPAYSPGYADAIHNTDLGNATRFVEQHGDSVRYCPPRCAWLLWTGQRWQLDETGAVYSLAKLTVREMLREAVDIADDGIRTAMVKHALKSQSAGALAHMLQLAQTEDGVAVLPIQLDADPWLLNCPNGTLDLRTGTLREQRRDDLITKMTGARYDPTATSNVFEDSLCRSTGDDIEIIQFLGRAFGSALVAGNPDEKLFFLSGHKGSGKTTLLEPVRSTMGDYAGTTSFDNFLQTREPRSHQAGLVPLVGKRFVYSSEVADGQRLAEALVNTMCGGDTLSLRDVYGKAFDTKPSWKLFLAANARPRLTEDEQSGIWRRMVLIPFEHQIPEADQKAGVKAELVDVERSGAAILNWLVDGCLGWQREGLQVPDKIKRATTKYREEQDAVLQYLAAGGRLGLDAWSATEALKKAFEDMGLRWTRKTWNRLKELGCTPEKRDGVRGWRGIELP